MLSAPVSATTSVMTHLGAKAALLPLLRRWREEGIEVLLFKGFYLAEFVYPNPAQRSYSDVDFLLRERDSATALDSAQQLGWASLWQRRRSLYSHNHEEANLVKDGVFLEPHRLVLDTATPWRSVQARLTEAAWEASEPLFWAGLRVRALHPLDSMLMGIVLARCWSAGDDWHLKASDYRDIAVLSAQAGLTQADLEARAKELHCLRTTRLFLQRCNPWLGVHDPTPPSAFAKQRWQLAVMLERGHLGLERTLMRAARLPGTLQDALRYTPAARPQGTRPQKTPSSEQKERIVRGVKAASHLRWPPRADPCVQRSEALFKALERAGYPVRLELGCDAFGQRHARICLPGYSLRDLEDVQTCAFSITEVREAGLREEVRESAALKAAPAKLEATGDSVTKTRLQDDTVLTLAPDQVSVESSEETVILDPNSGRYFSLDGVGGEAWQLLREPRSFATLRNSLLERYDISAEVLERDLKELLLRLMASGLVVVQSD